MADLEPQADQLGRMGNAAACAVHVGRGFGDGLQLGLRAAKHVRERPALLGVIVLLASLSFFSRALERTIVRQRLYPQYRAGAQFEAGALQQQSLAQRWLDTYRGGGLALADTLLHRPLMRACAPLAQTDVSAPWISLLRRLIVLRSPSPDSMKRAVLLMLPSLGLALIGTALRLLLLVPLLAWIRDRGERMSLRDWPRYWAAHYPPMFAWALVSLGFGFALWFGLTWNLQIPATIGGTAAVVLNWGFIVSLAFCLVPYAIVGHTAGLRGGIVGGLRLLRRNWREMIALFICFRIGYEIIAVWDLIPTWPADALYRGLGAGPAPLAWEWLSAIASALLGLWLAYAFMDIARRPAETSGTAGPDYS